MRARWFNRVAEATLPLWMLCAAVHAAPIIVTHGGVISGSYSSDDPAVAAVTIRTSEPVTLDHCTLTGRGPLIADGVSHVKLTVRDCVGTGQNPNVAGECAGRFIDLGEFDSLVVEHCEIDQTTGIYLLKFAGNPGGSEPIVRIYANRVKNIDGRKSDGHGGYVTFNLRENLATHKTEMGFVERQFLQLNQVHAPRMQVSWNHITNEPGVSRVEDNINLYLSGGTPASPMSVDHNCIRGAYSVSPAEGTRVDGTQRFDWNYTGGGIMLGDGSDRAVGAVSSFIIATDNVIVAASNYGIGIAAGHDISFSRNVILSSGLLPDRNPIFAQNIGAYVWDEYHGKRQTPNTFFNNGGRDNVIRSMKQGHRADAWTPDAEFWSGNTGTPGVVSMDDEARAEQQWEASATRLGLHVGVQVRP